MLRYTVRLVLVLTFMVAHRVSFTGVNASNASEEASSVLTLPTVTTSNEASEEIFRDPNQVQTERRSAIARLKKYVRDLPSSREKVAPAVVDNTGAWKVDLGAMVAVLAVLSVDDVKETVNSGIFIALEWVDTSLAWNASNYEGVASIQVQAGAVWTPNLSIGNSRDIGKKLRGTDHVGITSDGHVHMYLPIFVETQCSLDLTHYPYDEQICPVHILSFDDGYRWNITHSKDLSELISNALEIGSEWEMVNTSVQLVRLAGGEVFSPKITLRLRRKTTFYTVCLVLPMVMTSYMNTLVFLLPPESGEKISFLVSIFVSTSVFVSYFTSVMPRGLDSVPSTMKLFLGVIIESLLVLLATIVVLRRFHQQQWPSAHVEPTKSDQSGASPNVSDAHWPSTRRQVLSVKAEILDRLFFALACVGNTVFLVVLLYQSLKPTTNDKIM